MLITKDAYGSCTTRHCQAIQVMAQSKRRTADQYSVLSKKCYRKRMSLKSAGIEKHTEFNKEKTDASELKISDWMYKIFASTCFSWAMLLFTRMLKVFHPGSLSLRRIAYEKCGLEKKKGKLSYRLRVKQKDHVDGRKTYELIYYF